MVEIRKVGLFLCLKYILGRNVYKYNYFKEDKTVKLRPRFQIFRAKELNMSV